VIVFFCAGAAADATGVAAGGAAVDGLPENKLFNALANPPPLRLRLPIL